MVKFERMVNAGTKVINFSWGLENGTVSQAEEIAVPFALVMKKLFDSGSDDFLVVQSAGNDGHDATLNSLFATINAGTHFQTITGCSERELQKMMDRIVVAASVERPDKAGSRIEYSSFSNNGNRIDVAAPGGYILSTAPLYLSGSTGLTTKSGTSMAAAHVSGAAGLIWSACPYLTAPLVKQYLCTNSTWANGLDGDRGAPLLDAEFSVRMAVNTHLVQFNLNGGTDRMENILARGNETAFISDVVPACPGHSFLGWDENPYALIPKYEAGKGYVFGKNTTLYAIWKANPYTVMLNANGGTVSPTSIIVSYDGNYSALPMPVNPGHVFTGWFTEAGSGTIVNKADKVDLTGNITLYAHWTLKTDPLILNRTSVEMNPRQSDKIIVMGGEDGILEWTSDNVKVAVVSQDGTIFAKSTGSATITAKNIITNQSQTVWVSAKYSFWQWVLVIFTFGWIWIPLK